MLVAVLSCFDSTAPAVDRATADGVVSVNIIVPDSLKNAPVPDASVSLLKAPLVNLVSGSVPSAATPSSAVAVHPMYAFSHVPFAPEAVPSIAPAGLTDDGFLQDVPLGFSFTFYGNTYTKVAVYSNGFLMFGPATMQGFWSGDLIPFTGNPNNIIALAWTDWRPDLKPGSIRYETRGTAPNRRFIVQFVDVPEYVGTGKLNSQLVLSEGSNDITIYTATMSITRPDLHKITQGIENAAGTEAAADSVQNPANGVWSARVKNVFSLSNDAVRFSLWHENLPPSITPPTNLLVNTDPAPVAAVSTRLAVRAGAGLCTALVNPGTPTVTDDAPGATVVGVRSDGQPLNATYPRGVTTITWTATDAGGLTATSNQTVTVVDKEQPIITAPANISASTDRDVSTTAVAAATATAVDNCPNVVVSGARSDGVPLSAVFPVGLTTITWTATDESGNMSSVLQTVTVRDNIPPVIVVPGDFTVNATMPNGAVVRYSSSATDNVGVASFSCSPASGSVFPIGQLTVTCNAADAAGNQATGSFVVTVVGAHDQIGNLITKVEGLNLANGVSNPLLAQLRTAYRDPGSSTPHVACIKMGDFINMVRANKGGAIAPLTAADLVDDAQRIMNVMAC
jgi:hypothetical protein